MTDCTKITRGCDHCYAERFRGIPGHPFESGFDLRRRYGPNCAPQHIWCGGSVEDQTTTTRIRHLRQAPASVRFLSIEPLLDPMGDLDLDGIAWVIVGGESGPKARPMRPEWV